MSRRMKGKRSTRSTVRFFLVLLLLFLVSCGPAEEPPDDASGPADDAYPAASPTSAESAEAYPPPPAVEEAYPSVSAGEADGILFALDKPIVSGDTVISGVGPPGLPVLILNVTFMGEEIAAGVVNDAGTFSVDVSPLQASVRIGLTADLEAQGISIDDIRPGDGAISVPQVGYFFDSFVVQEGQ